MGHATQHTWEELEAKIPADKVEIRRRVEGMKAMLQTLHEITKGGSERSDMLGLAYRVRGWFEKGRKTEHN